MDWHQYIAVNSATAHPHYDRDGASYNMGNSHGTGGNLASLIATLSPSYFIYSGAYIICLLSILTILHDTVCFVASSGFFYNIIRVPPPDEQAAEKDSADLSGAEVICSIPASEPRKPSYYHSFGEINTAALMLKHL